MTQTIRAGLLLAGMTLFSATTQAVVGEQQWGKWYGNIDVMEFALNTNNKAGETLTLRCSDSQLAVTYEDTKGHYRVNSEGLNDVQLLIGKKAYSLNSSAFSALKHSSAKDNITFSSRQSGESAPFSAQGLKEALQGITWQDCTSH
ncbi:hypothetical protein [Yersinia sp. SCPM-O-B-9106 (C-191)]|uniref:hypothetical protein n=1 Tax=Yersinia sp. SCPM-O-B-9106 (C-191) TaxID=2992843 RepID=UPI0022408590|nr:hypothetical protein [Yersinia sp. SCPM-O-B-9106 (C-191)]UZM74038.1 hypothetical protein OP863_13845 [Yersinia sp. SCPM-O-B-9106 (C-191)]